MVAVPELCSPTPAVEPAVPPVAPVHRRRAVAVVATAMELLRPESDLLRIVAGISQVDVLLAEFEVPAVPPGAAGRLGGPDPAHRAGGDGGSDAECDDIDDDLAAAEDAVADDVHADIARLGMPGLRLHRLTVDAPLSPPAEPDLVAALSELVGFDPEPGVYCLAPAPQPGDPAHAVVNRAAQRIAQVYGLPLLRYRCLELSVVESGAGPGGDEGAGPHPDTTPVVVVG